MRFTEWSLMSWLPIFMILAGQVGRRRLDGGRTGSAAWIYRIWLEEILGFKLRGQTLSIQCVIPREWAEYKIHYRYKSGHYHIKVSNPHRISQGIPRITLDGTLLPTSEIPLVDDGCQHIVDIALEKP